VVAGTDGENQNPGWPRAVKPLLQTPDNDQAGEVSPDGKWLAYVSYKTGRGEIFVRPYPDVNDGQWQVSTAGGKGPVWSRDGHELFYADAGGALVSVRIQPAPWNATPPTVVLPPCYFVGLGESYRNYDVAPDGQRFIVITNERGARDSDQLTSLQVVLNWAEEVKRLVSGSSLRTIPRLTVSPRARRPGTRVGQFGQQDDPRRGHTRSGASPRRGRSSSKSDNAGPGRRVPNP
jgi:hypothetical protein